MSTQVQSNENLSERTLKRGDIVMVRKEWLEPGEDPSMKYLVLEESGPGRILVRALDTGLPLAPTYVYDVKWVTYAGSVPEAE